MRIIYHIFFTIIIVLLEIQKKSAEGNERDGNEAIIDTKVVEIDDETDDSEIVEKPKDRTKRMKNFVGTNLFGDTNGIRKNCFSSEDIALLAARRDFELLIPKTLPSCLLDDDFAKILLQYFYEANQVIDKMASGRSKTIAQKAFFDTLGGYLQYYMVSISMFSFYAGSIKLRTVENILELHDQSKTFLNTNGNGWRPAIKDFSDFDIQIEPLRIIIEEKQEEDTSCIQLEIQDDRTTETDDMIVALPRLDQEEKGILGNIWLPFKRRRTFNLKNTKSAFVLLRYFELTTRCYNFQGICQDTFNRKFKNWIFENLDIHLKDDIFYPGLGAILRILETLQMKNSDFIILQKRQKTQNFKTIENTAKQLQTHSKDWFRDIFGNSEKLALENNREISPKQKDIDDERRMMYIYITIIISVLLLVFVISVAYIVKWSNTPPTDLDVEKPPKKAKRVRIDEKIRRLSNKDDEEEVLLGPDSSSIVSSPELSKSSKLNRIISSKNVKSSASSNCFPLCTKRNSLEFDKPMDSDSTNEEMEATEITDLPTSSKFADTSKVINDRKYVGSHKKP
ncbi:uncharacterized protein LOC129917074 [Episyrphus balteatus]|uniref:uncharacterized protein LOC129917074 n=1 Tax=Episyrphus balteatus TaxID=286459 RepID=UPI002485E0CB|nr:uncharacterized protein LOC129917074 [Episyrphus balteatus]